MHRESNHPLHFARIGLLTVAAVYFLILVGGIVRASGAGMGCPDWPTCFGQWIPPTDASQLPADYQQIYAARGYADTAFNVIKTWTEYVNRLIGVSIGLLILATLVASRHYWQKDRVVVWLSLGVFIGVGVQGWLGSAVVASNLKPAMITLHMLMAFLIVSTLLYTVIRSQRERLPVRPDTLPAIFPRIIKLAIAMTLLQIAMGTQIRESVDVLANAATPTDRDNWRDALPLIFYVHRSFSSLILLINSWLIWQIIRHAWHSPLYRLLAISLGALIIMAILAGVSLDRLGFPAISQPAHLLLANLVFGLQFSIWILTREPAPTDVK